MVFSSNAVVLLHEATPEKLDWLYAGVRVAVSLNNPSTIPLPVGNVAMHRNDVHLEVREALRG